METLIVGMLALLLAVVVNPRTMKMLKKRRKAEAKRVRKLVDSINRHFQEDAWEPLKQDDEILERRAAAVQKCEVTAVYRNAKYAVMVREFEHHWHLSILQQPDPALPVGETPWSRVRTWTDFQRIKNEVCGPEHEGVEIYPKESRKIDGANVYHLFVMRGDYQFPFTVEDNCYKERQAEMIAEMKDTLAKVTPNAGDQAPNAA